MNEKIYIVIINYNGFKDTIECIESVLRSKYTNYQVLIVDNKSTDDSISNLIEWFNSDKIYSNNQYSHIFSKKLLKPIVFSTINENDINNNMSNILSNVILIKSEENYGFAGGNNLAIKFAKLQDDYHAIWLLNNDTVVNDDSLGELLKCNGDIIGSTIFYYDNPKIVQAYGGGKLNKWMGTAKLIGSNHCKEEIRDLDFYSKFVNNELDYISGASMLIKKNTIEKIGMLPDEYFLYWEETDYCLNAKNHGLKLKWSPNSFVYHRVGSSTDIKSEFTDYLSTRNTVYFFRKYFKWYLIISIPIILFGKIFNRIRRREYSRILLLAKAVFNGATNEISKKFNFI